MKTKNLFKDIPFELPEELYEDILKTNSFRVMRIVSGNHNSPDGFWYDQDFDEFVLLLKGVAQLKFDDGHITILNPGDYMLIPSHKKHRLEWTSKEEKTVWLTIRY